MKKIYLLFIHLAVIPVYLHAQSAAPATAKQPTALLVKPNQQVTYRIIAAEANTWGYEIQVDNVTYIRQLSVPGLQGNRGFENKGQATETAKLVAQKLRNNVVPPTVTPEELSRIRTTIK